VIGEPYVRKIKLKPSMNTLKGRCWKDVERILRVFCKASAGRRMILEEAEFKNSMVLISLCKRTEKR